MQSDQILLNPELTIGATAYGAAAVVYVILALLMATSWRGRLQGGLLLAACAVSALWALLLAWHASYDHPHSVWIFVVELVRDGLWILFLLRLMVYDREAGGESSGFHEKIKHISFGVAALIVLLLVGHLWESTLGSGFIDVLGSDPRLAGHLLLAIIGLVLIEQVFRNSPYHRRWAVKFLCLGLGGSFAYDFYLYSDAVLFGRLDAALWDARGFAQVLIVPLIGVAAARNPQWSLEVFVSRRVVFHTVTILVAGCYLLIMAGGGYFIRYWGGEWGTVVQVSFLFGAIIMLMVLLFSGQLRAQFKVFISKHFFSYQYDYRQEWLNLTDKLSKESRLQELRILVIEVLGGFVDSKCGMLWLRDERDIYALKGRWSAPDIRLDLPASDKLVSFLEETKWIVDLEEYRDSPQAYEGLEMPEWVLGLESGWLVVPLIQHDSVTGFVILGHGQVARSLNWEDRDLLRTAGSQAVGYLALVEASEALADARQFEAFNRLSAYVVHDLKNVVGQLSLIIGNAKKHKSNPEFVDDAFATVENAVTKMQRMLAQLRAGRKSESIGVAVRLAQVVREVVNGRESLLPRVVVAPGVAESDLVVVADRDRLAAVIENVVANAQEATPDDGYVKLRLKRLSGNAVIEVEDNGCGMDDQFIRERLFRPFDTTKGNAGMGVGVYECREFVRSLGGDVEVVSDPGEGTVFRLFIPADKDF